MRGNAECQPDFMNSEFVSRLQKYGNSHKKEQRDAKQWSKTAAGTACGSAGLQARIGSIGILQEALRIRNSAASTGFAAFTLSYLADQQGCGASKEKRGNQLVEVVKAPMLDQDP